MNRNVEINIPMFIGIILLVAVVTAILVYGVSTAKNLMEESNSKYTLTTDGLDNWFNITTDVQSGDENNNSINSNTTNNETNNQITTNTATDNNNLLMNSEINAYIPPI